jgi:hypothetical protein
MTNLVLRGGRDNSVGIATRYGLDRPGIESRCSKIFLALHPGPVSHVVSSSMPTGPFPGLKRPKLTADYPRPSTAEAAKGLCL